MVESRVELKTKTLKWLADIVMSGSGVGGDGGQV